MDAIDFKGKNKVYGKPKNWDEEKDGVCHNLHVFEGTDTLNHNVIISAWKPNEDDIKRINAGEPIFLQILGKSMPPVCVYTENPFVEANTVEDE